MNDVEFRDKWLNLADNAVAKTGDETEEERILRLKKSYQDYQLTIDEHKKIIVQCEIHYFLLFWGI